MFNVIKVINTCSSNPSENIIDTCFFLIVENLLIMNMTSMAMVTMIMMIVVTMVKMMIVIVVTMVMIMMKIMVMFMIMIIMCNSHQSFTCAVIKETVEPFPSCNCQEDEKCEIFQQPHIYCVYSGKKASLCLEVLIRKLTTVSTFGTETRTLLNQN